MNALKKATLGIALAAGIALGGATAHAQESKTEETTGQPVAEQTMKAESPLRLGYNALELSYTDNEATRQRAITDVSLRIAPNLYVGWSGMNEMTAADTKAYFGRNVLTLGSGATRLAVVDKRLESGSIDTKFGIRNTSLPARIGVDYGCIDVTMDGDAVNVTAFLGKGLGGGFSAELYQDTDFRFGGGTSSHTELQLNKAIGKYANLFARAESNSFAKPGYVVGVAVHR